MASDRPLAGCHELEYWALRVSEKERKRNLLPTMSWVTHHSCHQSLSAKSVVFHVGRVRLSKGVSQELDTTLRILMSCRAGKWLLLFHFVFCFCFVLGDRQWEWNPGSCTW